MGFGFATADVVQRFLGGQAHTRSLYLRSTFCAWSRSALGSELSLKPLVDFGLIG